MGSCKPKSFCRLGSVCLPRYGNAAFFSHRGLLLGFWDLKGREGMPKYIWNKKLTSVRGTRGIFLPSAFRGNILGPLGNVRASHS